MNTLGGLILIQTEMGYIMNFITKHLLETGHSVKKFRGALLEASPNFAPGSVAAVVYNFYRAIYDYYKDLMVNQFQLYSDVPKYFLNVTEIYVAYNNCNITFKYNSGNGFDLENLQVLNEEPFDSITEITYSFKLSPEIEHLLGLVKYNTNSSLFTKTRDFSVALGNGNFVTASFTPSWSNAGVSLKCLGIKLETDNRFGILKGGL